MPTSANIEALVQQYYKLVFHTIYGLTNNWEESQDLTQDTFQQAMKGLAAAQEASGPQFHAKAWLLRIALNTVRMQRRRKALFSFIPFSHFLEKRLDHYGQGESQTDPLHEQAAPVQPGGYGAGTGEDPSALVAEQDAVQRTMARLPEDMRTCLLLSIIGGLSNTEIATLLEIKEPTVRQRISRARQQFQDIYRQENGDTLMGPSTQQKTRSQQGGSSKRREQALTDTQQRFSLMAQPPEPGKIYG